MKKHIMLIATIVVSIFLFTSCSTVGPALIGLSTKDTKCTMDRGEAVLEARLGDIAVMMKGIDSVDGEASLAVAIRNLGRRSIEFEDSDITVYGMYRDSYRMERIGTWSARAYMEEAKSRAEAREFLVGFSGAVAVIGSIFDGNVVETENGTYYEPGDVFWTGILAASAINSVNEVNRESLEWLRKNLLFSSRIDSREEYCGVLLFPLWDYDEYIVRIEHEGEVRDFCFVPDYTYY